MNSINHVLRLILICFCLSLSTFFLFFLLLNSVIINNVVLKFRSSLVNSKNREGSFVTLNNGDILFIYSKYVSGVGDAQNSTFLASRVSSDGGITWSTNDKIVVENEGMIRVISVSLLRLSC